MSTYLPWLDERSVERSSGSLTNYFFPALESALTEPDGLLCAGGDLSSGRLLSAYRSGIFPWYSDGQPILWWSPDPRCVFRPGDLHVSRSLKKRLRHCIASDEWRFSFDTGFKNVIHGCAERDETWITAEMIRAYNRLHLEGHAHSAELWRREDGRWTLAGGLYGIAIGRCFFGESMFSRETDASKLVITMLQSHLWSWGYVLMDCQVESPHLMSLGATVLPRPQFARLLAERVGASRIPLHGWNVEADWLA